MKYIGGKDKYGHAIAREITKLAGPPTRIYEPFCGGLGVTLPLARAGWTVEASDINDALIELYIAVLKGWTPPIAVSEQEFYDALKLPNNNPMFGFVNLACTFNGRWLGRYQKPNPNRPNYVTLCRGALMAMRSWWTDKIKLSHCHYLDVTLMAKPGDVFYFDPPYSETSNEYCIKTFDAALFHKVCKDLSALGCHVFVSEYVCPVGRVVWFDRKYSRWGTKEERLYYLEPK